MKTITTYKGIRMNPSEPRPEDFDIEDIAHALSLMCRANGHIEYFFSVAQHSINCAREASARGLSETVQLACLIHDASEAYISDITRPVKRQLPEYRMIEEKLQRMIYDVFLGAALTPEEEKQISEIDDGQLYHEFLYFRDERVFETEHPLISKPDFEWRDTRQTEKEFLRIFRKLTDGDSQKD